MKIVNTKPELSVVVAHYKSKRIKKVINNLLSMKKVNLEIFLINDHIEPIKKNTSYLKDKRVRYIQHKKNLGPLATFNEGVKMSKRKYILISSDHDFFKKDALQKIIKPIDNNKNYAASFSNFNLINERGQILKKYIRSSDHFSYMGYSNNFFRALKFYLDPEHSGKAVFIYSVFKTKFFDKEKFYQFHKKYGLNADRIFVYDIIQNNKIYYLKDTLFTAIIHSEKFYKKRIKKDSKNSKIKYFYLQMLGYFENSRSLILKFFIIILFPYKLYQHVMRKFLLK